MEIENRDIASLRPYEQNPRLNDNAVEAVAKSIREFGFRQPIVVDADGVIVCGHTRYKAALLLGLQVVPVHVATDLTPEQLRLYRIADNKVADLSTWDFGTLSVELGELTVPQIDLRGLGFTAPELANLMPAKEQPVEDDEVTVDVPSQAVTQPGDLWVMGDQRLLCGDSTNPADVKRVMGDEQASLLFTSPPYLEQRQYSGDGPKMDWLSLMQGVFAAAITSSDAQLLVNLGLVHRDNEVVPYWDPWIEWMRENGWRRFAWYVWDQGSGLPGDWAGRFAPSHEFVFHFNKKAQRPDKFIPKKPDSVKTKNLNSMGLRKPDGSIVAVNSPMAYSQLNKTPDSVIRINRRSFPKLGHPAPFPIELPEFVMCAWGGIVYEPFSGSGSTLLAAQRLGRQSRCVDISPLYCDIAVRRWEKMTGEKAVREPAG